MSIPLIVTSVCVWCEPKSYDHCQFQVYNTTLLTVDTSTLDLQNFFMLWNYFVPLDNITPFSPPPASGSHHPVYYLRIPHVSDTCGNHLSGSISLSTCGSGPSMSSQMAECLFYDWITFACLHTHSHSHTHTHSHSHTLTLTHTLFFTQSLFTIHSVHIHFIAMVNNAPANWGVQRSLQDTDFIPFSHIPRGGIAGSC